MRIKIKDVDSIKEDELLRSLIGTIWEAKPHENDKVTINVSGNIIINKDEYEIVDSTSKKIRLIRTMVVEYEPNKDSYPEGFTIEQMAELDANADDKDLLFGLFELKSDNVKYEIIEE